MKNFILAAAAITLAAVPAMAGPFGVTMGQSIASLKGRSSVTSYAYKVTPPNPHEEFESYTALATDQTGICKIWGVGRDHESDRYGAATRAAYERLREALNGKYGTGKPMEFLRSGALWKDSDEWVMSIRQKERTHTTYWLPSDGLTLPDGIVAISLEVHATSMNSSYVDLTYEFANFKTCKAAFQKNDAESL